MEGHAKDVVECTFVRSDVTEAPYFSTPVQLGVSVYTLRLDYTRSHCSQMEQR